LQYFTFVLNDRLTANSFIYLAELFALDKHSGAHSSVKPYFLTKTAYNHIISGKRVWFNYIELDLVTRINVYITRI